MPLDNFLRKLFSGRIGSVSAEEAVAAGKGFHIPRPILYVGLGITALAVAAGVGMFICPG